MMDAILAILCLAGWLVVIALAVWSLRLDL